MITANYLRVLPPSTESCAKTAELIIEYIDKKMYDWAKIVTVGLIENLENPDFGKDDYELSSPGGIASERMQKAIEQIRAQRNHRKKHGRIFHVRRN